MWGGGGGPEKPAEQALQTFVQVLDRMLPNLRKVILWKRVGRRLLAGSERSVDVSEDSHSLNRSGNRVAAYVRECRVRWQCPRYCMYMRFLRDSWITRNSTHAPSLKDSSLCAAQIVFEPGTTRNLVSYATFKTSSRVETRLQS